MKKVILAVVLAALASVALLLAAMVLGRGGLSPRPAAVALDPPSAGSVQPTETGGTAAFADVSALRANTARFASVYLAFYAAAGDGGGGTFLSDPLDTSSADDGCTIIADKAGQRWHRVFTGAIDIRWCGAAADRDATRAINAAMNAAAAIHAGSVAVPGFVYHVGGSGSLSIPSGVSLVGDDSSYGYFADTPNTPYTLTLSPAATIAMASNSRIRGLRIVREGFAQPRTLRQAILSNAKFAGTAITIGAGSTYTSDVEIDHVTIVGFALAVSHYGERMRIHYLAADATAGILDTNCPDTCTIDQVELFPFGAITPQPGQRSQISAVTPGPGRTIEVTLTAAPSQTPLVTGDIVVVSTPGVPEQTVTVGDATTPLYNARATITVIDPTHFTVDGSHFSGAYTSGGQVYLGAAFRTGAAVEVIGGGSLTGTNVLELGHDVCLHTGGHAYNTRMLGGWCDGDNALDPTPIGILLDGDAHDTLWEGDAIVQQGVSIINKAQNLYGRLVVGDTFIGASDFGIPGSGIQSLGGVTTIGAGSHFADDNNHPKNPYAYVGDGASGLIFSGVAPNANWDSQTPIYQSPADCAKFSLDGTIGPCAWIPALTGSSGAPRYKTQTGAFTNASGVVNVWAEIALSSIGNLAGNVFVTKLPVIPSATLGGGSCAIGRYQGIILSAGFTQILADVGPDNGAIALGQFGSNQPPFELTNANLSNSAMIKLTCLYHE